MLMAPRGVREDPSLFADATYLRLEKMIRVKIPSRLHDDVRNADDFVLCNQSHILRTMM